MNFNRSSFLTSDGSRRKKQMLPPEIHSVLQALGFSFQVLLSVCLLPGAAALVAISFASFIACFLNSSSYCFPVPIDDTLLCFYYTLIVLYVSSFIIQDYSKPAERKTNRLKRPEKCLCELISVLCELFSFKKGMLSLWRAP